MRLRLVALAALVACSSSGFSTIDTVSGGGVGGSSGVSGTTGDDFGPNGSPREPRCPADPPPEGALCNVTAAVCTYGPDVREECNETYTCSKGRWSHSTPDCAADCPSTRAAITAGTACPDNQVVCSYEEGTCGCTGGEIPTPPPDDDAGTLDDGGDGGDAGDGGKKYVPVPGTWKCVAPPTTVACPSARPRVLDDCVKQVTCDYGSCELDRALSYSCEGRFWNEPTFRSCDP